MGKQQVPVARRNGVRGPEESAACAELITDVDFQDVPTEVSRDPSAEVFSTRGIAALMVVGRAASTIVTIPRST